MERRTFIVKAGVLFSLPLIITQVGCDANGDSDDVTGPAGSDADKFIIELRSYSFCESFPLRC